MEQKAGWLLPVYWRMEEAEASPFEWRQLATDVLCGNLLHASEVGDSARDFDDLVGRAGAQIQFLHGHSENPFASVVQLTVAGIQF